MLCFCKKHGSARIAPPILCACDTRPDHGLKAPKARCHKDTEPFLFLRKAESNGEPEASAPGVSYFRIQHSAFSISEHGSFVYRCRILAFQAGEMGSIPIRATEDNTVVEGWLPNVG